MIKTVKRDIPWYTIDREPSLKDGKGEWISFYNGESIVSMSLKDFNLSVWKKFMEVFKIEYWTYMENLLP